MSKVSAQAIDRQVDCVRRFEDRLRQEITLLITEELIEEHRCTPRSRRSDVLERVLSYFRRAAVADKYAIWAVRPFAEYKIIALSGQRGVAPRVVDDTAYPTVEAAMHAVFLRRIRDLKGWSVQNAGDQGLGLY